MFGRKKAGDNLGAEQRRQLVEAYGPMLAEVDEIIERCSWFLEPKNLAGVPPEYHQALRETLETGQALRELVVRRTAMLPTGTIVIAELAEETNVIHQTTLAANDLMKRAGTDAAAAIILQGLLDKARNAQD